MDSVNEREIVPAVRYLMGFRVMILNSICNLPPIYVLDVCDGGHSRFICRSPSGCSDGDWTIVCNGPFVRCMHSSFLNI